MTLEELGWWLSQLASGQAKGCMFPGLLDPHDKLRCIDGAWMLHWRYRIC